MVSRERETGSFVADGTTITKGPEAAARGHHLRPATSSSCVRPASASFPVSFARHLLQCLDAMSPGRKRQAAVKDSDLADDFEAAIARHGLYPASLVGTVILPPAAFPNDDRNDRRCSDAFGIAVLARGHQQGLREPSDAYVCNLCFYPRGVAL